MAGRSPAARTRLLSAVVASLLGLSASPIAAQPLSARLERAEQEVEALAQRAARLHETYIQPVRAGAAYTTDSRLADGRLLFLLGDYGRSSIVFLDIVENAPRTGLSYYEARFFLAESLFRARNLIAARGYYEEIAEDESDRHRPDAVQRLLEIAFETRSFAGLDELYDQLRRTSGSSMRPDIIYIRAKTIYFSGDSLGAIREFESIPADSELYAPAQYFVGTAYVRMERWEQAVSAFEQARRVGLEGDDERSAEVADLAALALGRIYYEGDDPALSLESYQAVSRTSPHYDRALYEMCWAYMMEEKFADALRTLEILMLAVPDSRFLPRAQLLRGDLLLRLSRYDNAQAIFETTVEQFGPLERELAGVIGRESDPDEYFSSLIDSGSASLALPGLAREWVEDDESMRRALTLIGDLEVQATEINESREIIDDIEAVLSSSARLDVFPELRQGYGHALEVQSQVISLNGQLADAQAELVRPALDAESQASYGRIHDDRIRIERELARLPATYEEMGEARTSLEGTIAGLEREVFRQSYELQTQRAQVTAMRLMLREEVSRGERSPVEAGQLERELQVFERSLDQLERSRDALRRQLEAARLSTGIGSVTAGGQTQLIGQYELALRREQDFLAARRGAVADRDSMRRIESVRDRLELVTGEVDRFFAEVDRFVTQQTGDITRQLVVESALLDEYERLLRTYGGQGERLAGEVAFANFIEVQDEFHDLILRADVGIVDVAWRQKEDRTTRIDELFEERNQELDVLDAEFREVLQDE